MHDVFISYQHESKTIADNMVSVLESNRIRCWYAPRDVVGDYATSIVEAIQSCKVFVLILNANASESPHVLNEVEIAYKRILESDLTIVPFKLDEGEISMAMEYYIKRLHWIDASNKNVDDALDALVKQIEGLLPERMQAVAADLDKPATIERVSNKYYESGNTIEASRLNQQRAILKSFDQDIYDKILLGRSNCIVLDIGSNTGDLVIDRLGSREEVASLLGIEFDEGAVQKANDHYKSDFVEFIQADCESNEFDDLLTEYEKTKGISGFDVVNISMLILHLRRPYKLLNTVRKHMNPGAVIFIRDIDDQLNIAFPDPDNFFSKTMDICKYLETSGYRWSGREIYNMLKKAGFTNITLEKQGLSTIGMNHDERAALFNTCFSFITEDMDIMCERYPNNEKYASDRSWLASVYDDMEEAFQDEMFFYQEGFMIFTATK